MNQEREYRNLLLSVVEEKKKIDTDHYVEGYASTYDRVLMHEYDGVKYYEQVARGAFDGADLTDVVLKYDHKGRVYARPRNKTLIVYPDDHGLFIAADLSKSEAARQMHEEIRNGLIDRMSYAFIVQEQRYDETPTEVTRVITKISKVYDVSAVSLPANPETYIEARSWIDGVISTRQQELLMAKKAKLLYEIEVMK